MPAQKVRQDFISEAPAAVPQAKLEVIVANSEVIQQALTRLREGADWAQVAREMSDEPNVDQTGGLKDFAPIDAVQELYREYARTAPLGQISEPFSSGVQNTIVRVVDRQDLPLTDAHKPSYGARMYADWLANTQSMMRIEDNWTMDQAAQNDAIRWVISNISLPVQPTPVVPIDDLVPEEPQPVVPEAPVQPGAAPGGAGEPPPDAPADGQ
jgi:parvulin-like peptidyl-prolyl isomerase